MAPTTAPALLLALLLLMAPQPGQAYPKLLVKEKRCASALTAGEMIMGQPVVQGKGQTVTVRFCCALCGSEGSTYQHTPDTAHKI